MLNSVSPFFIVDDLQRSLDFYCLKLGFEIAYTGGGDGPHNNFWGIVRRDHAMLMLKRVSPDIHPQPNHTRHEWARWDAYINVSDPDLLYREVVGRGASIHRDLADTGDGLRAFEIIDNSGYVLCFGRPNRA